MLYKIKIRFQYTIKQLQTQREEALTYYKNVIINE